jgi:hypothetical protein
MKIFSILIVLGFILLPSASQAKRKTIEINDAQICRAGIGTIMNRPLNIVEFYKEVKQIKYISYKREEDGATWKFKCHVKDKRIFWASDTGYWRDSGLDSIVEFEILNDFLIIHEKHNSGYTFHKRFKVEDLIGKNK